MFELSISFSNFRATMIDEIKKVNNEDQEINGVKSHESWISFNEIIGKKLIHFDDLTEETLAVYLEQ